MKYRLMIVSVKVDAAQRFQLLIALLNTDQLYD